MCLVKFHHGKQIGNYVGMILSEDSSGGKDQLQLAPSLHSSSHLPAKEHCQGSDGAQAGSPLVLDVTKWLRVFAVGGVRFADMRIQAEVCWPTEDFSTLGHVMGECNPAKHVRDLLIPEHRPPLQ
jgi:hypothetical protein